MKVAKSAEVMAPCDSVHGLHNVTVMFQRAICVSVKWVQRRESQRTIFQVIVNWLRQQGTRVQESFVLDIAVIDLAAPPVEALMRS